MSHYECTELVLPEAGGGGPKIRSTDPEVLSMIHHIVKEAVPGCEFFQKMPWNKPGSLDIPTKGVYEIYFSKLQDRDREIFVELAKYLLADGWEPINFNMGNDWFSFRKKYD